MPPDVSRFEFEVLESDSISTRQRELLLRLFRANYRDANPAFIDKSLSVLRHVAVADAYRVFDFDPETFVCIGDGRPIGYPRIDFDVEPEEWEAFASVNRDRGDALLAIAWLPDGPSGW